MTEENNEMMDLLKELVGRNLGMADIAGDKPSEEHEWSPISEDWHILKKR